MKRISIITAIHNGIDLNRIFIEYLKKYTVNTYELIIIDNVSTDGSREFFKQCGAIVIENDGNYSYPHCQNQGIAVATGEHLFFLNNDIIVSPRWDERLIETANKNGVDIISAKGVENMGSKKLDKQFDLRWKLSKNPFVLLGFTARNLRIMHKLMYGNWEMFCDKQYAIYGNNIVEGIVGNNVMMTRRALEKVGLWDEQIQGADWDLYMRTKKRSMEYGDIKPCQVALGVFIHHFVRMTSKYSQAKPTPFADAAKLMNFNDKWSREEIDVYGIKPNK